MDARKRGPRTKHASVGPSKKRTKNANIMDLSRLLHTPKEINRFRTIYSDKRLIIPKFGTLDSFSAFKFPNLLKAQHVEEFIGYKGPVYPDLVRFFYCNLSKDGNMLISRVKGKTIKLDTKIIGEILNIPFESQKTRPHNLCEWAGITKYDAYVALCRFDKNTMEQKRTQVGSEFVRQRYGVWNLTVDYRLLHYFLSYILVPKAGNYSQISKFELRIMFFMFEGCLLNWAYFVKFVMFASKEAIGLPSAKEVTRILEHFRVDFSKEVMYTPTKDNLLDLNVLHSMKIVWNEHLHSVDT